MQKPQELIRKAVGFFGKNSNDTNILQFVHNGNEYVLNTTAVGSGSQDVIVSDAFKWACEMIKNGTECTSVSLSNVTESFNGTLCWAVKACGKQIQLYRNATQNSHLGFEECVKNATQNIANDADHQCAHAKGGANFSLIVLTVFSLALLLVVGTYLYKVCKRESYDSIELPAEGTASDASKDEESRLTNTNRFEPGL